MDSEQRRLHAVGGPEEVRHTFETALFEVKRVIVGQEQMLERVFVALLADGHILLEGVPGLAKTMTIKAVSDVLGGQFRRIQFTPDLVPSDLVGTRIYRADRHAFETELGPVFCNFLLADEINRAPAKVQSALLEVMQERQVTIGARDLQVAASLPRAGHPEPDRVGGHVPASRSAGRPLHVQDGGRLPLRPGGGRGRRPLARGAARDRAGAVPERLVDAQAATREVFVDRAVNEYAVALVGATRRPAQYGLGDISQYIEFGASPRGSINLIHGGRALALLRGRGFVLPEDVRALALDVMRHRLVLTYEALAEGVGPDSLLERIVDARPGARGDADAHGGGVRLRPQPPVAPATPGGPPGPTPRSCAGWT